MRQTKIEQLLGITVWTGLIGGILLMVLLCKGIWESGQDMASPDFALIMSSPPFAPRGGHNTLHS